MCVLLSIWVVAAFVNQGEGAPEKQREAEDTHRKISGPQGLCALEHHATVPRNLANYLNKVGSCTPVRASRGCPAQRRIPSLMKTYSKSCQCTFSNGAATLTGKSCTTHSISGFNVTSSCNQLVNKCFMALNTCQVQTSQGILMRPNKDAKAKTCQFTMRNGQQF